MASSDDPSLRLQRTAYMTPRRRSPSIVDAVDRPREQTTRLSPESIYPTPPESSPWQACHQTGSATISRPAPLKLLGGGGGERNAVPQTPQRRVDVGIHSSFTPFHDIKQDIDKLIGELPIGSEDLIKSKEETVVERSELRNGKHLSLFLYSPSKKKPLEPTGEDVFGSGEGIGLIGEETLALPCINSSALTDLEHQQQPVNRSLLSKASCVFKKTIKFIVPRGLHRLSRGNTSCEVRLEGEGAEEEEENPRPIRLPPTKKARSIPMRNPPPGCCHHSQQQTLPTSTPGASNSILLLPIMSNNSTSSPPQRRRRRQEPQPQQPQPQQPKSSIRRKPVPKVPPPKYPAAATPPHHVATTIRGRRRRSTILRIHNVPSYIVHQDDFFHPPPHPHPHHRFSPPESKSKSSTSSRIQSLHASIYDVDVDDPMMPDHHHQEEEKQQQQQQEQQKAQKGQKNHAQIPLSLTPLYIQAAASLCIMAIAAGADFLVEDDSSYGYSCGVGRKMGSWRRRGGCCKISERRR